MTQEDKARAYDEALKKARFYHGNCPSEPERKKLEKMFPVLHESEDEEMLQTIIRGFENWKSNGKETFNFTNVDDILAYLEKRKEPTTEELYAEAGTTEKEYIANTMKMVRAMREKQKEQKPAEWSEEDEKTRNLIIETLDDNSHYFPFKETKKKMIDWLKSLRPSWKPSDEQMEALQNAVALTACDKELARLYNQLQKL